MATKLSDVIAEVNCPELSTLFVAIKTCLLEAPPIRSSVAMAEFLVADVLWSLGWGVAGLLFLAWALRVLNRAWWRPRWLERALRAQGLNGTAYRFPYGDLKENARFSKEARAKPMPLAHNIIPRLLPFLNRAMDEYGKISFTWFGPVPQVTITDPELVREVLSNKFGHFGKPKQHPLGRFFARGLAVYEGEKWVKHRRILNPAFHAEKLKRMLPAFSACCSDLMDRWENMAGSEACYELDVWPELQSFTGDVISRTAFGSSYEEGRPIFHLQAEQAELIIQVVQNLYVPGYRFLPTPKNKRIKAIDREIRSILRGIIKKREQDIKTGKASTDDLLGLLMESNMKHLQEDGNKNAGMTTEDVIEECKLFYFAGQETTSVLLTWTMICLSMHPTWQVRAREEVLRVFGYNKPDLDGLSHLKIVTMILYEVLRLYPPAILLQRQTYKTMKLGDVVYPPGVLLLLHLIFVHHDPNLWGKDASEFNPERFAEGVSKASKEQVAFFPFGGGPRICIGQNFALLEAKMGLSMILQHFSFDLSPSYAHAPHTVLTLHPQHGAQIRFRKL
ncbi:cytochrome P450 CYP72A616-like [Musa acuminata AAA Group]